MKKFSLQTLALLAIILMLLQGCSKKDDSNPTGPGANNNPPAAPTIEFKGPQTNSQDTYAQLTIAYAKMFNGFSNYFASFNQSGGVSSGNTWTWTWSGGGLTVTYAATKQTDGSYAWKCTYNGTDGNHTYTNFVVWEGTVNAAGNGGSWQIYETDVTTSHMLAVEYVWSTSSTNILTGTFAGYNNGVLDVKYVVTNNPNGTGEVNFYDVNVLVFKSSWAADGTGTWWTYDSSTGAQTSTGTWS